MGFIALYFCVAVEQQKDKEEKLSEIFGIRTVPTLLFSPLKGDPYMTSGVIPKHELKKKIEEILLK